ncbi:hypothetical protein [Amphiplicatus metriothermophilus]|uniref:Uncharacterized protein n=1 Tax=Amphiplicatus metriothermophilus TaxID=1519374 RepID=A0A239PLL6_9PROT|nr:hypothetical protein [Amphiplicatus metriothermophilus]MBB5517436.1 hypothetical protein [Amphiplicatus metriothermophilus]SNT68229.1 hypothetical protein SAMN06297382_0730 [Amphiplicatus metriothermophilus]
MGRYLARAVERASWVKLAVFLALLLAYSFWAFRPESEFMRALAAAGGSLPEMRPGFPAGEPAASLARLGDLTDDYVRFQAIDIPYAIFNTLTLAALFALGAKRFGGPASPLRWLILSPFVYLFAEFVENPLLAILANGAPGAPAALVPLQQAATTLKWTASLPALIVAGILLLALLARAGADIFRRRPSG